MVVLVATRPLSCVSRAISQDVVELAIGKVGRNFEQQRAWAGAGLVAALHLLEQRQSAGLFLLQLAQAGRVG